MKMVGKKDLFKGCLFVGVLICCSSSIAQFTNVIQSSGLDHHHETDIFIGGGAAFFDYNNDGWLDLYVTGGFDHDRLFQNDSKGSFIDVSEGTLIDQLTQSGYSFGVTYGDINNDGCDDLLVYTYDRSITNKLLLNTCDGRFIDVTSAAGLLESSISSAGAMFDYNSDGFLDLYVANYIDEFFFIKDEDGVIVDLEGTCLPNFFYRNNGDLSFDEVSESLGVDDVGCALSVLVTDYDQDGDQDLYVANDHGETVIPNSMYENQNASLSLVQDKGLDVSFYSMGIASGDYDADGDLDYYVTSIGDNALLNNRDSVFTRVEQELGVANGPYADGTYTTGWGANFFDYDNDLDLDLFVSNGFIDAGFLDVFTTLQDTNKFYVNENGSFTDVTNDFGMNIEYINRGSITGDYDNDGDLDLFVVTIGDGNQKSLFYRNDFTNDNNYLKLKLEGVTSNRNAFGSTVRLYTGGSMLLREHNSGGSHASQNSPDVHFGLGTNTVIDSLVIRWPTNNKTVLANVPVNEFISVLEGATTFDVLGCTNPDSDNYNPNATIDFACTYEPVFGCTDPTSLNYNSNANVIDDSCSDFPSIPLSVGDLAEGFIVYPNPATSTLHINTGDISHVMLYSLEGKVLLSRVIEKDQVLDVTEYERGVYFIRVVTEGSDATSKIILR